MKTIRTYIIIVLTMLFIKPADVMAQSSTPGFAPDGVVLNKNVVPGSQPNTYTINLEAFVTGQTVTTVSATPLDVILVLDFSNSMTDSKSGDKWPKLMAATSKFLKSIKKYEEDYHASSRVGVIAFGNEVNELTDKLIDPTSPAAATLISNFDNSTYTSIGGTNINLGIERAYNWLAEGGYRSGASTTVVVFTDGHPEGSQGSEAQIAQKAIQAAYNLKNTYNAEVFTVGLLASGTGGEGENYKIRHSDQGYVNQNTTVGSGSSYNPQLTTKTFLERISSYYKQALITSITTQSGGTKTYNIKVSNWDSPYNDDFSYYQRAESSTLESIFLGISEKVIGGASYGLTKESTTVIDVVSSAFKLPDGASGSTITLQVAECKAVKSIDTSGAIEYTFEEPVPATSLSPDIKAKVGNLDEDKKFVEAEGGKTVQVLGFDFSENYVGEDIDDGGKHPRGYKLIISFPIEIDPRNPGGANVATNTEDSGIYFDEDGDGKYDQIGGFEIPHAKIPNLVIKKTGLHKGESATFYVYKLEEDGSKSQFPIVLVATQTSDDPSAPCYARAKIQEPGRYEVEESTWSWAYYISTRVKDYAVDDKDKSITPEEWNELGYGDKGLGYQAEIPWTFGTVVPEGTRSIIRNVNDFTEDPTQKGTLFTFANEDKPDLPAHGEASKNNVFYESR